MKTIKKVLLLILLLFLTGCRTTGHLVYTKNGSANIGTWIE